MKKKPKLLPIDELSKELHEIYYLVGKRPLHKLIISGFYGFPGFASNGTFTTEDGEKHLSITLGVGYRWSEKQWECQMTIIDGDDFIYSYWKPFTLEEWEKALKIYNDLYIFDPELVTEFFH